MKAKCLICGKTFQRKRKTGFCSLTCGTIGFSNHLIVFAIVFSFLYFFSGQLIGIIPSLIFLSLGIYGKIVKDPRYPSP